MTDNPNDCGVGIRGVAMGIDSVVWFGLLFAAIYPIAALTGDIETTATGTDADLTGTPATAAFLLWLGLGVGYHTLFEWRSGKTLGKYLVGIRAVDDDGSPLTLRSAAVRNVSRLVDVLPLFYVVGIVAALLSDRYKRVGDRLADTVVVRT
ncbi:RDD family protein [Halorussus marinus]|uniref:RDD family protein n=1 Tax=Halorussus marinus TaxID=2505976 RepID=UPI00106E70F3|nr:RDD family protein [Halorussus marinus]